MASAARWKPTAPWADGKEILRRRCRARHGLRVPWLSAAAVAAVAGPAGAVSAPAAANPTTSASITPAATSAIAAAAEAALPGWPAEATLASGPTAAATITESAAATEAPAGSIGTGLLPWLCDVHGEGAAAHVGAVEALDRGVGLELVGHLDKAEAAAAAGLAIEDDLHPVNPAEGREERFELGIGGGVRKIADVEAGHRGNLLIV
jgi:hypothetical protein